MNAFLQLCIEFVDRYIYRSGRGGEHDLTDYINSGAGLPENVRLTPVLDVASDDKEELIISIGG